MLTGFGLTALPYSLPDPPGDSAERLLPFLAAAVIVWIGAGRAGRDASP